MGLSPTQTGTPPSPDLHLPLPVGVEQPTEISESLQVYDYGKASSTTSIVEKQIANDHRFQQDENNRQSVWPMLTVGFCTATAAQIVVEAREIDSVSFHLLRMLLVLAFSAIFVAANIASKHANVARVLEHVGGFLGNTAFFFAITIAFPLCLKVISWTIYALAILVIFICNYRQLAPLSLSLGWCC